MMVLFADRDGSRDFNPQGPCGPTAFWKISDRESTGQGPQVLLEDLFPLSMWLSLAFCLAG
jgi:hypothetical protein